MKKARPQERRKERQSDRKKRLHSVVLLRCNLMKSSTCPCIKVLVFPYTACTLNQRSPLLCMHMHFHQLWQGTVQSIPEKINPIYSASRKPGHWENKVTLLYESNYPQVRALQRDQSPHTFLFHFLTATSTLPNTVGCYCNGHHVNLDTESPWQQFKHLPPRCGTSNHGDMNFKLEEITELGAGGG